MDLNKLSNALDVFDREVATDIPLQIIRAFIVIAQKGECYYKDVEHSTGMTDASTSRAIAYWTNLRFDKKPGIGYVERFEDNMDQRLKKARLTPKGRAFVEKLRRSG